MSRRDDDLQRRREHEGGRSERRDQSRRGQGQGGQSGSSARSETSQELSTRGKKRQ